jgi:hypothetical protein
MQSSEVYRLLARRIRRGLVIFPLLGFISAVFCGLALGSPAGRPWAAAASLASFLLFLGFDHVRKRNVSAHKVSSNPQLVYWAHPTGRHQPLAINAINNCTFLMLHLRDGTAFEVGLPTAQMRAFIAWLGERSPSIRWGAYDQIDPAKTS